MNLGVGFGGLGNLLGRLLYILQNQIKDLPDVS